MRMRIWNGREFLGLEAAGHSAVGTKHKGMGNENEDRFVYFGKLPWFPSWLCSWLSRRVQNKSALAFAMVADGMGGMESGAQAASMATAIIAKQIKRLCRRLPKTDLDVLECFQQYAIPTAHRKMKKAARRKISLQTMGTTIACLAFGRWGFFACHLGDTRIYLVRSGVLERLTKDHKFPEDPNFRFSEKELMAFSKSEFVPVTKLLRCLAVGRDDLHLHPGLLSGKFRRGDRFLIVSDGGHDFLSEEFLLEALNSEHSPREIAEQIVRAAQTIGDDDITAVVMRVF